VSGVFAAWAEVPGMAAAGLPEAMEAILRELARSVAEHRRRGRALDALPGRQQELLRAMDGAQRQFFLEELARADAEAGRDRFQAALGRWRDRGRPALPTPIPTPRECPRKAAPGASTRSAANRGALVSADPPASARRFRAETRPGRGGRAGSGRTS
jgi:hypothetical protein